MINTLLTSFLDLLGLLQVGCSSTCRYRCHLLCPLETSWDVQFKLAVCLFKLVNDAIFPTSRQHEKKTKVGFSRNSPDFSFAALCQTASETPSLLFQAGRGRYKIEENWETEMTFTSTKTLDRLLDPAILIQPKNVREKKKTDALKKAGHLLNVVKREAVDEFCGDFGI